MHSIVKSRVLQQITAADPTIAIYDMDGTGSGTNSTGGGRKRGRVCMELAGHTHGVSDVAWARDSRLLASASDDKSVRLWDTETVCEGWSVLVFRFHFRFLLPKPPQRLLLIQTFF